MTAEQPGSAGRAPNFLSADWDQPWAYDPERSYVIASLPRSGSTMLSGVLHASGRLGLPTEYFNAIVLAAAEARFGVPTPTLRARWHRFNRKRAGVRNWAAFTRARPASMAEYVERLHRFRSTENGAFGVKLHWDQVERLRAQSHVDLLGLLHPRRVILLTRRDHLRQAISYYRARGSQRWAKHHGDERRPIVDPDFNPTAISKAEKRLRAAEANWRRELEQRALPVHEVVYEDLDADFDGQLGACFRFLGEPDIAVPERPLQRLADDLTEEWVARLREVG